MLGRALRCQHYEGLSTLDKYQKIHPVVINFFKTVHVSVEETGAAEACLKEIKDYLPDHSEKVNKIRKLASDYKKLPVPNQLIFRFFNENWMEIFRFANDCKLRLGYGFPKYAELEEKLIGEDIVVDAMTLVIMAFCGCLRAFEAVKRIYVSCSTVDKLQEYYLSNNFFHEQIKDLFAWLNSNSSITIEPDGLITADDKFANVFSNSFCSTINIAKRHNIPYLCGDTLMVQLQNNAIFPILEGVKFITIPSICGVFGKNSPDIYAQMIYELLKIGSFISFSAETIVFVIQHNNYEVSEELLRPFLICKSDYDMQSFASVYLRTMQMLKEEHIDAAEKFTLLIMNDAERIWRRGSFYRDCITYNAKDMAALKRNNAIRDYEMTIIAGVEGLWSPLPSDIKELYDELVQRIAIS